MVILQYDSERKAFKKICQETCIEKGRTSKNIGQYIGVDPRGHAVMMGAIEDFKCAFVVKHNKDIQLSVSPPILVKKANTLIYDIVGLDGGPNGKFVTFACLEATYKDANPFEEHDINTEKQELNFYKLDLESCDILNECTVLLEQRSNFLVSVPGSSEGPGGVLIFSSNAICYTSNGSHLIQCPIPRRVNDLDSLSRSLIFACCSNHASESSFYFLAQSEYGDIFKITLTVKNKVVVEIQMTYFDTLPVASALCILKPYLLFVASEFGNHALFKMEDFGSPEGEPVFSSAIPLGDDTFFFLPRPLKHLKCIDEIDSLSPIMHCQVHKMYNDSGGWDSSLYVACGRGPKSALKIQRQGIEISNKFPDFSLNNTATGIWVIRKGYDDFIIVSFSYNTEVFKVNDGSIETGHFYGILKNTHTLTCRIMKNDTLIQIFSDGIRSQNYTNGADERNWEAPIKQSIVDCATNSVQVVIALSTQIIVYFEQEKSRDLIAHKVRRTQSDVKCMTLSTPEDAEGKAAFLVIGLENASIYVLKLDSNDLLLPVFSMSSLPGIPSSFLFTQLGNPLPRNTVKFFIGLENGSLIVSQMDAKSGVLSNFEIQKLESEPIKMFECRSKGKCAVLITSSNTWLYSYCKDKVKLFRLAVGKLGKTCCFYDRWPDSLVIASDVLRILNIGGSFEQVTLPLEFTPRKFVVDTQNGHLVIIETDHNAFTKDSRLENSLSIKNAIKEAEANKELVNKLCCSYFRHRNCETIPPAPAGHAKWASVIRIVNYKGKQVSCFPLKQNIAAFSVAVLCRNRGSFVFVGSAKDMMFEIRKVWCTKGILHAYSISDDGKLELAREMEVEGVPSAMSPFGSGVLVAIGGCLRLYSFINSRFDAKCEVECSTDQIISILVMLNNIIVGDVKGNLVYLKYKAEEPSALTVYTKDHESSFLTTTCFLDSKHIAKADKFGNIFIVKLPLEFIEKANSTLPAKDFWNKMWHDPYPLKSETVAVFNVGEVVLSLQKTSLFQGGLDVLMYSTLSGTIGVIGKIPQSEDGIFLQNLEKIMPSEHPALCGQDHFTYRSCYYPVKNIVDGDFCEEYQYLDPDAQKRIADVMQLSSGNILRKLSEVRSQFLF